MNNVLTFLIGWQGLFGLLIGTILQVISPWIRASLEAVAESGKWESRLPFDWRYMALFLLPVFEFGVAFVTVEGLWAQAQAWTFVGGSLLAYSGTHLGKELIKGAAAVYKIVGQASAKILPTIFMLLS